MSVKEKDVVVKENETDTDKVDEVETKTDTDDINLAETKTNTDNLDVVDNVDETENETETSEDLIETINKRFDEFEKIFIAKLDGILSRITARSSDSKEKPEKTQEEIEAEYIQKLKEDTKNI